MPRIEIHLPDDAMSNLKKLAAAEFRDPRSQAAIIIINELKRNELQATQQAQDEAARLMDDILTPIPISLKSLKS